MYKQKLKTHKTLMGADLEAFTTVEHAAHDIGHGRKAPHRVATHSIDTRDRWRSVQCFCDLIQKYSKLNVETDFS